MTRFYRHDSGGSAARRAVALANGIHGRAEAPLEDEVELLKYPSMARCNLVKGLSSSFAVAESCGCMVTPEVRIGSTEQDR
jgi:hypothetical protein